MADQPSDQVNDPIDYDKEPASDVSPGTLEIIMNEIEYLSNTYGPKESSLVQTEDLHDIFKNASMELNSFIRQPACDQTIDSNFAASK